MQQNTLKNPFLDSIKIKKIKLSENFTKGSDADDLIELSVTINRITDVGGYVKVYVDLINNLPKLINSAIVILHYIFKNLKYETDYIDLNISNFDFSLSSYNRGISNLIEYNVISKKEKTIYWINPTTIFKGNRLKFLNKYEK